ncbi:acyl carrier protein [Pseudomonas sp. ICMP22404]|nr:acyl carrier protein [Pseudomonas sp. ICMP22404]
MGCVILQIATRSTLCRMDCGKISIVEFNCRRQSRLPLVIPTNPEQYKRTTGVTTIPEEILPMSKTKEKIIEIIAKTNIVADASMLRDNINLADQGIDSMDIFTIMLAIQDYYEIQIPDSDIESLLSINDLTHYIESKQELQ